MENFSSSDKKQLIGFLKSAFQNGEMDEADIYSLKDDYNLTDSELEKIMDYSEDELNESEEQEIGDETDAPPDIPKPKRGRKKKTVISDISQEPNWRDTTKWAMWAMGQAKLLTQKEEQELAKRMMEDGDEEAEKELIIANLRLVAGLATKYTKIANISYMDLFQEGVIGLITAIRKFDYSKGFKLSTYATNWVKAAILKEINEKKGVVRIPGNISSEIRKLRAFISDYEKENLEAPSEEVILEHFKIGFDAKFDEDGNLIAAGKPLTSKKLQTLMTWVHDLGSLNEDAGGKNDGSEKNSKLAMIADEGPSIETIIEENDFNDKMAQVLRLLKKREREILELRFGIGHEKRYSLKECSEVFNITKERVRQIEEKAIKRLRESEDAKKILAEYLSGCTESESE